MIENKFLSGKTRYFILLIAVVFGSVIVGSYYYDLESTKAASATYINVNGGSFLVRLNKSQYTPGETISFTSEVTGWTTGSKSTHMYGLSLNDDSKSVLSSNLLICNDPYCSKATKTFSAPSRLGIYTLRVAACYDAVCSNSNIIDFAVIKSCSALNGQSCTESNACSSATGTYDCDGQCVAQAVSPLPQYYGTTCALRMNSCTEYSEGVIGCDGYCTATVKIPQKTSCCGIKNEVNKTMTLTSVGQNYYSAKTKAIFSTNKGTYAPGENISFVARVEQDRVRNASSGLGYTFWPIARLAMSAPDSSQKGAYAINTPAYPVGAEQVSYANGSVVFRAPNNVGIYKIIVNLSTNNVMLSNGEIMTNANQKSYLMEYEVTSNGSGNLAQAQAINVGSICSFDRQCSLNTSKGVISCEGKCVDSNGVEPPADPEDYGGPCKSIPNYCGETSDGTLTCDGTCNALTPKLVLPPTFGDECTIGTKRGTIGCGNKCVLQKKQIDIGFKIKNGSSVIPITVFQP